MKSIKILLISKKELKKVMEQYKEFFTFCEQYGYTIHSYDVSIVPEYDINNHSGVYYGVRKKMAFNYIRNYIRVEIIFKRSADFVSLSNAFKQQTGQELPTPPDINANQIIGFSVIRVDSKEEFHQQYRVYCMRFGIISNDIKIIHYQIFKRDDFDHWPLNREPFKGCSNVMLSSAYNDAIQDCATELIYSIKNYNSNHWGNDWYVGFMKDHHPNDIPVLSKTFCDISKSSKSITKKKETIKIKKVWPLLEFAKAHGKMQVGEFSDKETGKVFKACIFTKPDGTRTFVAFSTKLGELTPKQIVDMKNELQVAQLESGNYSLCKTDNGLCNIDIIE